MANVYAVKSGNWSDTTVWNTGALPTTADDVYSNNFVVTIDGTYTVRTIRNEAATGIIAGGYFQPANGSHIITTVDYTKTTGGAYYIFGLNAPDSASYTGNIFGGTSNSRVGVDIGGTGTFNFIGTLYSYNASNSPAMRITGAATVNIIVSGTIGGGGGIAILFSSANATLNITGDVSGTAVGAGMQVVVGPQTINIVGNVYGSTNGYGISINNNINVNLTIVGNLIATSYVALSIGSGTTSVVSITGTISASSAAVGAILASVGATNIFSGPFINNGAVSAVQAVKMFLTNPGSSTYWRLYEQNQTTARTLYTADAVENHPAVSDVRLGVTYASGNLTGTCNIPPANAVQSGVPVDNTTGTAALTAASLWDYSSTLTNVAGSIGERLKNVATTDVIGQQLAFFK